jgi:hypothetical protein
VGRITTDQLDELLGICLPDLRPWTYIETGAHKGERLLEVRSRFETVVGIELEPAYVEEAKRRIREADETGDPLEPAGTAFVVAGDSRKVLADLLGELGGEPLFVHLDAHYCKADPPAARQGFPLWDELDLLSLYPGALVVSVDDVHTFGRERPELRASDGPEWEEVTAARIREAFCPRRIYASHQLADELVLFLGLEL